MSPFCPFFWFLMVKDTKLIWSAFLSSCSGGINWSFAKNFMPLSQNCCVHCWVLWYIYYPMCSKKGNQDQFANYLALWVLCLPCVFEYKVWDLHRHCHLFGHCRVSSLIAFHLHSKGCMVVCCPWFVQVLESMMVHEVTKWMGSLDLTIWTKATSRTAGRGLKTKQRDNKQDKRRSKTNEARRARLLGA